MIIVRHPIIEGKVCCVYKITVGSRFYIGSTKNLSQRIDGHMTSIRNNKTIGGARIPSLSKWPIKIEILEIVEDVNNLIERENYYLTTARKFGMINNRKFNARKLKKETI